MAPSADTQRVVAQLFAAYPTVRADIASRNAYASLLADLPPAALEEAVVTAVSTSARFPAIAELRALVMEQRLDLPAPIVAYEQAQRWAALPSETRCPDCKGDGVLDDGDDPVAVTVPDDLTDPDLRAQLERIAEAGVRPLRRCPRCDGEGRIPNTDRAELAPAVRRALYAVGGPSAIRDPENPETLRSQFLRAYEQFRRGAVEDESLASAGLQLSRGGRLAALTEGASS